MSGLNPDWGNAAKFSRAQTNLKTRQSNIVKLNCVMSAIWVSHACNLNLAKHQLQACETPIADVLQFSFSKIELHNWTETR